MKSYKEQFDKLTEAYINLRVNPFSNCNCFVGNLLDEFGEWSRLRSFHSVISGIAPERCITAPYILAVVKLPIIDKLATHGYTMEEIVKLEQTFLLTYREVSKSEVFYSNEEKWNEYQEKCSILYGRTCGRTWEQYLADQEEGLFQAFEATLEELKKIHIAKGEDLDNVPQFTKRELKGELV